MAFMSVCAVWAVVVGIIGIVEHIIVPVVSYFLKKRKDKAATKNLDALERALNRFDEARHA